MLLNQRDEIGGRVAGECRLRKVWIARKEILCRAMNVGEVAPPATGDQNLLAQSLRSFQNSNAASALARLDSAHQACRPASQNQRVK